MIDETDRTHLRRSVDLARAALENGDKPFGVVLVDVDGQPVATRLANGETDAAYAAGETFKPSHAATMHAILIFPAMAWILERTALSEQTRMRWLGAGIGLYILGAAAFIVISSGAFH